MAAYKRIVVTTDFSKHSKVALGAAVVLAKQFKSDVYLVHVLETPVMLTPYFGETMPMAYNLPELLEHVEERAEVELQKIAGQMKGVRVLPKLLNGKPSLAIAKFSSHVKADLIIISTAGLGFVKKALMGSTTDGVLKHATMPVMVVR